MMCAVGTRDAFRSNSGRSLAVLRRYGEKVAIYCSGVRLTEHT